GLSGAVIGPARTPTQQASTARMPPNPLTRLRTSKMAWDMATPCPRIKTLNSTSLAELRLSWNKSMTVSLLPAQLLLPPPPYGAIRAQAGRDGPGHSPAIPGQSKFWTGGFRKYSVETLGSVGL